MKESDKDVYIKLFTNELETEVLQLGVSPKKENPQEYTVKEYFTAFVENSKDRWAKTVYSRRKNLVAEICESIGNYKLTELTPHILQRYYDNVIDKRTFSTRRAIAKDNFKDTLLSHGYSFGVLKKTGFRMHTYQSMLRGKTVDLDVANKLCDITGIKFDSLFKKRITETRCSWATNHEYKKVIRVILASARRQGLVEHNYATSEFLVFPRQEKKPIECMEDDEAKILFKQIMAEEDIRIKTSLLLFITTAMRKGEVAGLEWNCVDWNKHTITISKTVLYTEGFGIYEKAPKTTNSVRTISCPTIVMDQLKEYKTWQDSEKKRLGSYMKPTDKVFARENGDLFNPDLFLHWLRKVEDKAGLKHYTLHSLRHTNIMIQTLSGKVPMSTISKRAGHYRESVTSDMYNYSVASSDKLAAQVIDEFFTGDVKIENKPLEAVETTISSESIDEYRKAKEEAKRLGFNDYEEYLDYLEFVKAKKERK